MKRCIVSCGIFRRELESLLERHLVTASEIHFLPPGLHVSFDKLNTALEELLPTVEDSSEPLLLLYGDQCHPDMARIGQRFGAEMACARDCIGMLLGKEELAKFDAEARTFYLTPGWLEDWEQIFRDGLGWDDVDARQNFGIYERILLLDTGVMPLDEERILGFFDYTAVPIEVRPVSLDRLAAILNRRAGTTCR